MLNYGMRYSTCLHGQDTPTCREDSVHVLDELKEVEEDQQHDRASNGEAEGVVTGELMNTCRVTKYVASTESSQPHN